MNNPSEKLPQSKLKCESGATGPGRVQRREFVQMLGVGAVALSPGAASAAHERAARRGARDAKAGRQSRQNRPYNEAYAGEHLERVAFPIGGIGAGMMCLEGCGALSHVSLRHRPNLFHAPSTFAALCVKGREANVAKVLEGPLPGWKVFGRPGAGFGSVNTTYGLPRFDRGRFTARFPFGTLELEDESVPVSVQLTGWSPFLPGDADNSSLPVGGLEYAFKNPTASAVDCVFSFNTRNFMSVGGGGDTIRPFKGGYLLWQEGAPDAPEREGGCAVFVDEGSPTVDHAWFQGGWWDSLTMAWENIENARLVANPPADGHSPGASLFVPFTLAPGASKTVRVMLAWYVPNSRLRIGNTAEPIGPAFAAAPSRGTARHQQPVSGYRGGGLVNSFDPLGDGATGTLTSPEFTIGRNFIRFLIGGGAAPGVTCMRLLVNGGEVRTATGANNERLEPRSWDVSALRGKKARLQIVDQATVAWGHINVDHIELTDDADGDRDDAVVLADFEGSGYNGWAAEGPSKEELASPDARDFHVPWYAGRFSSIEDVAGYWRTNYQKLRAGSQRFSNAFYDTTLPPEVVESVAANLTILKSPTVLRQVDGKLWCWEGCDDDVGSCHGSCTHVWNYAQALCHLFPELERSLRDTEFNVSQSPAGHQTFRSALPIGPVDHSFHAAADGQLGGVLKVHRDWRISGDTAWLRQLWPKVRQSLDYCIRTWDPRDRGVLEEPQHNTYDIEYWGPNGHCTSFYLSALAAAVAMGEVLGDDVSRYQQLLDRGVAFMEEELFDGEYFVQKIQVEGLNATFTPIAKATNGKGYLGLIAKLNEQGPKYQYGAGCLSDGVLGLWMAEVCGMHPVIDREKIKSNLKAIHRHNFKRTLADHVNPQRPGYAVGDEGGLLLCTWPKGGELSIPFVYSNEVWTGIEHQVASHLMMHGFIDEGLEIVRACRDRYDGRVRNPFNEFECGNWYARAMSSYAMIQALSGARYDAIDKTLYLSAQLGDNFRSFLSTATGYGTVGLADGRPFLEVRHGTIPVEATYVDGSLTELS